MYSEPGAYTEINLGVRDDEDQWGVDTCDLYLVEPVLEMWYGGEWMQDPDEYSEGAFVALNADDLLCVHVSSDPLPGFVQGQLKLEAVSGSSKIKVWTNWNKVTQVTLPKTWNVQDVTNGIDLYVEGVEASGALRDVELKVTYSSGSEQSHDKIRITVVEVVIDTPDSYPALACKDIERQVGCTVTPSEAGGGTYQWSKVSGPGTVTFTPNATAEDPQFSTDKPGRYAVKVEYTRSGRTFTDTTQPGTHGPNGDIVVWKMRFDFVGPPVTHWSIEGYPADGSGPIFGLLGSKWGDKVLDQSHQSFTARAAHLHSYMWTDGKGYADEYDPGSKLNPSGEHRYEVWLDVDDATVDVVVSATWYPTVDVCPVSTDIGGGASVICSMDGGSYGYYGVSIFNGERKESQPPFTNPDTWTGAADGSVKVGEIEAGIAYIDHGGNPGQAGSHLSVFFDVEPD